VHCRIHGSPEECGHHVIRNSPFGPELSEQSNRSLHGRLQSQAQSGTVSLLQIHRTGQMGFAALDPISGLPLCAAAFDPSHRTVRACRNNAAP
jgi:hypothetical protein